MKKAQSGGKAPKKTSTGINKVKVKMATPAEKYKFPSSAEGMKAQSGTRVAKRTTVGNTALIPGAGLPSPMKSTAIGKTYKGGGKMGKCRGGC